MQTILFSLLTGVCFGVAVFLRKVAFDKIGMAAFIVEVLLEILAAVLLVSLLFPFKISQIWEKTDGLLLAMITGIATGVGVISFYLAVKNGSVLIPSVVSPVLASLLATLLAVLFIGESLSLTRIIGLLLSLGGLFIFLTAR